MSDVSSPHPPVPVPLGEGGAQLTDDRGAARGWGRIVVAAVWGGGIATVTIGSIHLLTNAGSPIGPRLMTLCAGLVYLGAAIGLTHNGRRMRRVAWACIGVALAGPIVAGVAGLGDPSTAILWSPWERFGADTWFVSLLLPLVGCVWLWWSNPRRIVDIAEGNERRGRRSLA